MSGSRVENRAGVKAEPDTSCTNYFTIWDSFPLIALDLRFSFYTYLCLHFLYSFVCEMQTANYHTNPIKSWFFSSFRYLSHFGCDTVISIPSIFYIFLYYIWLRARRQTVAIFATVFALSFALAFTFSFSRLQADGSVHFFGSTFVDWGLCVTETW